jgi:hypothetical protein
MDMMGKQCSALFSDVFDSHWCGHIYTCQCGITHFDGHNEQAWHAGELDELRQREYYVEHNSAISTMQIHGKEIVLGCTCDLAQSYESFILNHTKQLAEYLNKLAVLLKEESAVIKVKEPG